MSLGLFFRKPQSSSCTSYRFHTHYCFCFLMNSSKAHVLLTEHGKCEIYYITWQYETTLDMDSVSVNMIKILWQWSKVMPLIMTCVMGFVFSRHSQGWINYSGTAAGFGNMAVQCCSCSPLCKLPLALRRCSWYSVIVLQLLDRLHQSYLPTEAHICSHNGKSVHMVVLTLVKYHICGTLIKIVLRVADFLFMFFIQ